MDKIREEYLEWLYNKIETFSDNDYNYRFSKILEYLANVEFVYHIQNDRNRYEDGVSLRWQYEYEEGLPKGTSDLITGPCSILEMMYALAIKIEGLMDEPTLGDRTNYWFWSMMRSLGLNTYECMNGSFNKEYVDKVVKTFLDGEYQPNGRGGLFTVNGLDYDLATVEIWIQMLRYIETMTDSKLIDYYEV